jgi:hypothetical protein
MVFSSLWRIQEYCWEESKQKSRLAQKETKQCGCRSYFHVALPINSSIVILDQYFKHVNHYPRHLSDLCTYIILFALVVILKYNNYHASIFAVLDQCIHDNNIEKNKDSERIEPINSQIIQLLQIKRKFIKR